MTEAYPFTPLQTAVYHLERGLGPWNVQFELDSRARLDADRLTEAVRRAASHHPLAGATHRRDRTVPTGHVWVVPEEPSVDLTVTERDGTALDGLRSRLYGERIDLEGGSPFRVALARGAGVDGGDRVLFATNHVAMDGVGTFAFAQSVCRAYRGVSLGSPAGPPEPDDFLADYAAPSRRDRLFRAVEVASRLRRAVTDPPARLATGGVDDDGPSSDSSLGFHHRRLDAESTARIVGDRPPGVTVNDALLAALQLAVADWNHARGTAGRERDRISLLVPVNLRPRSRFYEGVGMHTSFLSVRTDPAERRTPGAALRTVSRRVERLRAHDGAAWVGDALSTLGSMLDPLARCGLAEFVDRFDDRLLDTAICSNLGRLPTLEGFEAENAIPRVYASPPVRMPIGVGFLVGTYDGRLEIGLRYARAQFDPAAARQFTGTFVERLEDLT